MAKTDVAVIGAGLAGLAAAVRLCAAGYDVVLHEASDAVGGRVRTDARDGLLLDRGFQLLNPAYPEAARLLDLPALDLRPFAAGACLRTGQRSHIVADPRRVPTAILSSVRAPLGGIREKASAARWAAEVGFGSTDRIRRLPDESLEQTMRRRGVDGVPADLLRLFLSGVLAEDELTTSRRFGEFLLRSFLRGTPSLPANGMQAIPEQLADRLPVDVLRLDSPVARLADLDARAVVVAADPATAMSLLGRAAPTMKALTTYYHLAPVPPATNRLLHLDLDRNGPIRNTAVVSTVAPVYAARGALVASTILGADDSREAEVRAQAGRIYGVEPSGWEHVATYAIPAALPSLAPGTPLRRQVDLGGGVFVAGDHRDTASIQGALVSGRRAADAVAGFLA